MVTPSFTPMDSDIQCNPQIFMNILFWNRHGAASSLFISTVIDLMNFHRPCVLILVETKVFSAEAQGIVQRSSMNRLLLERPEALLVIFEFFRMIGG